MKKMLARLLLVSLVAAGAVALGCGGGDDDDDGGAPVPTVSTGNPVPGGGGSGGPTTTAVSAVADRTFDPRRFTVNADAEFTVEFTNKDSVPHTFTIQNGPDSGTVAPGASATIRFEAPAGGGGIAFFCQIHGQGTMNGTIEYR